MTCRMENLDTLLPRILPQVLPCPKSMALDALQIIALDFCKRSSVWVEVFQDSACAGENVILLSPPRGVVVDGVLSLAFDGMAVDKMTYASTAYEIVLESPLTRDVVATIEARVRPSRTATAIPEPIIEEWGDILAFGALAKIKSMSGAGIEWTDAQGASMNLGLYENGCSTARTRMYRKRRGCGSLYITGGE